MDGEFHYKQASWYIFTLQQRLTFNETVLFEGHSLEERNMTHRLFWAYVRLGRSTRTPDWDYLSPSLGYDERVYIALPSLCRTVTYVCSNSDTGLKCRLKHICCLVSVGGKCNNVLGKTHGILYEVPRIHCGTRLTARSVVVTINWPPRHIFSMIAFYCHGAY